MINFVVVDDIIEITKTVENIINKVMMKSNLEYKNEIKQKYKYKIICEECGLIYYRQRLYKNFTKKYRCGKCKGKLSLINY